MTTKNDLVFCGRIGMLNDEFNVIWRMTNLCNYDCYYCYSKTNISLKDDVNPIKIIDFILNLSHKKINIIITGGEATLHPKFLEIISYLLKQSKIKNKIINILLLSNLSKPVEFFDTFFNLNTNYSNANLSLQASFHKDFVSFNDFLNKIKYLHSNNYNLTPFPFMISSNECIDILNSAKNDLLNLSYSINSVNIFELDYKKIDKSILINAKSSEMYVIYYDNYKYIYNKLNMKNQSFKKFICSGFKHRLTVDQYGFIYKCLNMETSKPFVDPSKRPNIFMTNLKDYIEKNVYQICESNIVGCRDYISLFKMSHFTKLKYINEEIFLKNIEKNNK